MPSLSHIIDTNHCILLQFMQVGRTTKHSEFKGSTAMSSNSIRRQRKQSLVYWEAPKHYLTSAMNRWPLSVLRKSTFSFYCSSKMLQGCYFTPGIMALEAAAREARQSCSFCRATTMLLSFSMRLSYRSTSAFPRDMEVKL